MYTPKVLTTARGKQGALLCLTASELNGLIASEGVPHPLLSLITGYTEKHRIVMSQNALSNPSNTPASSRPEPKPNVSWNDPTQRAKGRQMLNQLAHSSPAILILQPFDILSNDWDSWWELLDGEERKKIPDTTLPEIDALLDSKWDETFPSFTHPKVRVMLRDLVSRFLFGGNRDRKVYSFWEETTFVELAL